MSSAAEASRAAFTSGAAGSTERCLPWGAATVAGAPPAAARAAAWAADTASVIPEALTVGAAAAGAFWAAPPPWVHASRRMETPLNTREPPPDS